MQNAPTPLLPPPYLRFMGEDDGQLLQAATRLAETMQLHDLGQTSRLLDIGCGYGRLAIGLKMLDYRGTYLGFDTLQKQVEWCQKNLASDRYSFIHVDAHNDRYNPTGIVPAERQRFPTADATQTHCCAFSVFTHMHQNAVQRVLAEIHRVLIPGGVAVTTWLLFSDARLAAATSRRAAYPLTHALTEQIRCMDAAQPLRAIGYHWDLVCSMIVEAGLRPVEVTYGTWAGGTGTTFQDRIVLIN